MSDLDRISDDLDLTPRMTIWLDDRDRALLSAAIEQSLSGPSDSPIDSLLLQQVRVELSVVEARGAFFEIEDQRARTIENLPEDTEPVRLSEEELNAIRDMPNVPQHLLRPIAAAIKRGHVDAEE